MSAIAADVRQIMARSPKGDGRFLLLSAPVLARLRIRTEQEDAQSLDLMVKEVSSLPITADAIHNMSGRELDCLVALYILKGRLAVRGEDYVLTLKESNGTYRTSKLPRFSTSYNAALALANAVRTAHGNDRLWHWVGEIAKDTFPPIKALLVTPAQWTKACLLAYMDATGANLEVSSDRGLDATVLGDVCARFGDAIRFAALDGFSATGRGIVVVHLQGTDVLAIERAGVQYHGADSGQRFQGVGAKDLRTMVTKYNPAHEAVLVVIDNTTKNAVVCYLLVAEPEDIPDEDEKPVAIGEVTHAS